MAVAKPQILWRGAHPNNFTKGRGGALFEALVTHTPVGTQGAIYAWFNNAIAQASTWYSIGVTGLIEQYVAHSDTAFAHGKIQKPRARLVWDNGWTEERQYASPGFVSPNRWAAGFEWEDLGIPGREPTTSQWAAGVQLYAWFWETEIAPHADKTGAVLDLDHLLEHNEFDQVDRPQCPSWPAARRLKLLQDVTALVHPVVPSPREQALRDAFATELRGELKAYEDDAVAAAVRHDAAAGRLRTLLQGG